MNSASPPVDPNVELKRQELEEKKYNLLMEKKEEEKNLFLLKRELEKYQRVIWKSGRNSITSLKNILEKNQGDSFVQFLKKHGVLVGRSMDDYEDWIPIQSNQGEVYLAKLKSDYFSEPKIIKLLDSSPENRLTIQNEIQVLLRLKKHPCIIQVNNVFIIQQQQQQKEPMNNNNNNNNRREKIGVEMDYYRTDFMRWVKGQTFSTFSGNHKPEELRAMNPIRKRGVIINVFRKILSGIAYIHEKGIAHRDLKPDNILMNNEFDVKIIDFGIARDSQLTLTQRNMAATLRYLSPEGKKYILENSKEKLSDEDYRARDLYSFGLMFLECLCPPSTCEEIPTLLMDFPLNENSLWKSKFKIQNVGEIHIPH